MDHILLQPAVIMKVYMCMHTGFNPVVSTQNLSYCSLLCKIVKECMVVHMCSLHSLYSLDSGVEGQHACAVSDGIIPVVVAIAG